MLLVDLDKKGGGRVYWPVDGQAVRQGRAEAGAGAGNGAGFGKSTPEQLQTLFNNRLSKGQICDQRHFSAQLKSQHLWKT